MQGRVAFLCIQQVVRLLWGDVASLDTSCFWKSRNQHLLWLAHCLQAGEAQSVAVCLLVCSYVCMHFFCERVKGKNTPFTFARNRYDGGMVTACAIDVSVTDAARCLGCVDRLSRGRFATVIHSGMNTETNIQRRAK